MPADPGATDPIAPAPPVSRGYANYALGLLVVVYVVNFVDRQILAILLPSIQRDLDLNDTQLGILGGVASPAVETRALRTAAAAALTDAVSRE